MDTRLEEAKLKDEILLKIRNKPDFNQDTGRFIKTKFCNRRNLCTACYNAYCNYY